MRFQISLNNHNNADGTDGGDGFIDLVISEITRSQTVIEFMSFRVDLPSDTRAEPEIVTGYVDFVPHDGFPWKSTVEMATAAWNAIEQVFATMSNEGTIEGFYPEVFGEDGKSVIFMET